MITSELIIIPQMRDKYNFIQFLFYSLGILAAVSKEFFLIANDYWMYKFRDPTLDDDVAQNRTGLQTQFTSSFHIMQVVVNLSTMILSLIIFIKTSMFKRYLISMSLMLICMLLTIVLAFIDTDDWQEIFFGLTLVIGGILSFSCSLLQVTNFQLAPKYPSGYLTFITTGLAISGIISSLAQIISLAVGVDSKTTGVIYFGLGSLFILSVMFLFALAYHKSAFFKYYLYMEKEEDIEPIITKITFIQVIKKIKFYLIGFVLILGSSIMIHPGVTSLVTSKFKGNGNLWNDKFFVPVITFLLTNCVDVTARELCRFIATPRSSFILILGAVLRLTLIPLLMFCNAQPRHHLDVLFDDWTFIVLMIIFGFTNGYLANLAILQVAMISTKKGERRLSSLVLMMVMMTFMIPFSFLSPVLVQSL